MRPGPGGSPVLSAGRSAPIRANASKRVTPAGLVLEQPIPNTNSTQKRRRREQIAAVTIITRTADKQAIPILSRRPHRNPPAAVSRNQEYGPLKAPKAPGPAGESTGPGPRCSRTASGGYTFLQCQGHSAYSEADKIRAVLAGNMATRMPAPTINKLQARLAGLEAQIGWR